MMMNRVDQIRMNAFSTNGTNIRYVQIKVDKRALNHTIKRLDSIILNLNSLIPPVSRGKVQVINAIIQMTNLKAILGGSK